MVGGPIALVKDNDQLVIDIAKRKNIVISLIAPSLIQALLLVP
jgi:dihydroxyacid dehydratase/phosphogluconate dehydratase